MSAISPNRKWSHSRSALIRVLVIDDSVVMRSTIARMFEGGCGVDVAGMFATTKDAFDFLSREQVDVVLLDHEMPGQKGLDALPAIIEAAKGAHVIMLSSHCKRGEKTTVKALSLGAADAIAKPTSRDSTPQFSQTLIKRVRDLAASSKTAPAPADKLPMRAAPRGLEVKCIAIGASTGGIHTLSDLLGANTDKPGVPIFVTQHLPEAFMPYYAEQVARMSSLPVSIAKAGEFVRNDHIYIAPGNANVGCEKFGNQMRIALSDAHDTLTNTRPSVNLMFRSLAKCYGAGALGIVLTGIGRDGTAGAEAIVKQGGTVIAQDAQSSVIWGMPGAVTRAGLASANLRPEHMLDFIQSSRSGEGA
ncbi:MAG: chemotaxis protein CheB [Sphingobium sp.]